MVPYHIKPYLGNIDVEEIKIMYTQSLDNSSSFSLANLKTL